MERKRRGNAVGAIALGVALGAALIGARAQANVSPAEQGAGAGQAASSGQASGGQAVGSWRWRTEHGLRAGEDGWRAIQKYSGAERYSRVSAYVDDGFYFGVAGSGLRFLPRGREKIKTTNRISSMARKMMLMTNEINKGHFDRPQVTCFTCHHGANDPVGTPSVVAEGEPMRPPQQTPPPADAPTADQLIDKYVAALGGADAINKVTSRVEKGNIAFAGGGTPIEIYAKAPNKRISITKSANGESATAFDGTVGWMGGGRGPRVMNPTETLASKMDADIHFATDIKTNLSRVRAGRPEKIGDVEMYTVVGLAVDQTPVRLYFDEKTGLLTRLIRYTPTAFGRLPTQIDYADYRDVDGVKVPFRWTLARVNGRFTIQIDTAQQNVPIDDAKFAMPAAGAAGQGGPQH